VTSMTGFGHGERRDERTRMTLEIRSYNNRYLELYLNLPFNLKVLEPRIREYLSARVLRGKVELFLGVFEVEEDVEITVDSARVRAYVSALEELKRVAGIRERMSLSHLTALEALWTYILPLLDEVFGEYQRSRAAEGEKTAQDIRKFTDLIRGNIALIEGTVPKLEQRIMQGLRDRFRDLLGEGIDESRILAETAVLLVKFDVNEEIQRMKAHLGSLFDALKADGAHGKRLDFVCQELGREINTIGSKSTMLEVDQAVIAVKDALEKIREQIRNVE
jgi:uncharacterized protein (TIGR00255 family)